MDSVSLKSKRYVTPVLIIIPLDTFCHSQIMAHSKKVMSTYPGGVQRKDEKRVFVMNTLFNLAETFLIAALIDFFDKQVIEMLQMTIMMIGL